MPTPRKRKSNRATYQVIWSSQHAPHAAPKRQWLLWLAYGWIRELAAVGNQRCAEVSPWCELVFHELGAAVLPRLAPSLRTNSQVIDALFLVAHGGDYPLTRGERLAEAEMRSRLRSVIPMAQIDELIHEQRALRRAFAVRAQYVDRAG